MFSQSSENMHVYVDASVGSNGSGIGVVIRRGSGDKLDLHIPLTLHKKMTAQQSEMCAVLHAAQMLLALHKGSSLLDGSPIKVHIDCQATLDILRNHNSLPSTKIGRMAAIVIRSYKKLVKAGAASDVAFVKVSRSKNKAHAVSRKGRQMAADITLCLKNQKRKGSGRS